VSAVAFRLQPCTDATEASLDALTFGDPYLYEKLLTLNRVEILAEIPARRAGTIWYRVDREFCFVEAVAIRDGMYPLVYKVLPEMMAAQLGYSYVGRYFNMSYGYATRSLVWDENNIAENGARSFASVYPGMVPIVKVTAIIAGSPRVPVIVRQDQDSMGAAYDAQLLNDPSLANKLSEVSRLEVVTGTEGTRAGTIWYFRNGNYCFVIATAFRPEAPAQAVRLAPLLAAQLFGYRYLGNYTSIPADLKDKALCWDRFTGTPIPELAPLSDRLSGVQDFVVTFDEVTPDPSVPPVPEPDPYPQTNPGDGGDTGNDNCESETLHLNEAGYVYDGCYWAYSGPLGESYYWEPTSDGKGGAWIPFPYGTEITRDPGSPIYVNPANGMVQIGWNVTVTYADGNGGTYNDNVSDYSQWPNGTLIQGYYDYNYYADGQGSYYSEYSGNNNGGGDNGGGNNYPEAGTVVQTDYLTYPSIYWEGLGSSGSFIFCDNAMRDWHADGQGGSYWDGGYYNQNGQVSDGTVIYSDETNYPGQSVFYSYNNQFPTYYIGYNNP
jgi:hypothetical protein